MPKTKKELKAEYREQKITGGIICIKNTQSGRILLESTPDIQGSSNRFEFAKKTGSCVSMKLQRDWVPADSPPFVLEVLAELEKGSAQTDAEFKADLLALKEMWLEKLAGSAFY